MQNNPSSNITSVPYTFVLGLLTACWSQTGYDSAAHVIEVRAPTACYWFQGFALSGSCRHAEMVLCELGSASTSSLLHSALWISPAACPLLQAGQLPHSVPVLPAGDCTGRCHCRPPHCHGHCAGLGDRSGLPAGPDLLHRREPRCFVVMHMLLLFS